MSTGRSPFAAATRSFALDQPLANQGRWLDDGTHDTVVIEDLDTAQTEATGQVHLVMRAPSGGSHKERVFVLNQAGNAFNWLFRQLLGAVLQSVEAQTKFRELLGQDSTWRRVLESLRGMRVRIKLETADGYRIAADTDTQKFQARLTNGTLIGTPVATATEAERQARALGHKKAFRNVTLIEAIDADTTRLNLQAFNNAAASIEKSAVATRPAHTQFDGYTGTPPDE